MTSISFRHVLTALLFTTLATTAACKKKADDTSTSGTGKPVDGVVDPKAPAKTDPATQPATTPPAGATPATATTGAADPAKADPIGGKTVLDVAKANGHFTTFLKAVDAAGLTATLAGPGPFTVFAPTDDAFAKLPPKDLDALLADKAKLVTVLSYHVVPGKIASKDIAALKTAKTVQGGELAVDASAGLKIGGATIITPDLDASNGVIDVIDTVLQPPA